MIKSCRFRKKFDCAVRFAMRATELKPDYFSALYNPAWPLYESGRHKEAQAACAQALSLSPNNSFAWGLYSYFLNALGRQHGARDAVEQSLALNANMGRA